MADLGQGRLLALANVGREISDAAFCRRLVRGYHEGGNMASSIGSNAGSDLGADYRGRSINLEKNKDHKSLKQRRCKALA